MLREGGRFSESRGGYALGEMNKYTLHTYVTAVQHVDTALIFMVKGGLAAKSE